MLLIKFVHPTVHDLQVPNQESGNVPESEDASHNEASENGETMEGM